MRGGKGCSVTFHQKVKKHLEKSWWVVAAVGKSLPTVQGALNRLFETSFTRLLPDNTAATNIPAGSTLFSQQFLRCRLVKEKLSFLFQIYVMLC